jgi:hypothetical protein
MPNLRKRPTADKRANLTKEIHALATRAHDLGMHDAGRALNHAKSLAKGVSVLPISDVLVINLATLARTCAKLKGIKVTTVGTNCTKTATFFDDLESGETSCTLRKYDLVTEWFASNWPDGHKSRRLKIRYTIPRAKRRTRGKTRKSPVRFAEAATGTRHRGPRAKCHSACNIDPPQIGLLRCLLCNEAGGRGC